MDTPPNESNTTFDLPTIAGEIQLDGFTTYRMALWINNYCLPFLCVAGLVGNVLSLIVLLQKRNREIPCYLYLIGLAISDCVVLTLGISFWSYGVFAADQLTRLKCRFMAYFFQWSCLAGSLLIVFATMHKFFAFCLPLKMTRWRTVRKAFQIIITIYIASAVYSVPYFFTAKVVNKETCVRLSDMNPLTVSMSWVGLILNCIIPFTFVVVMNSLIIKTILSAESAISEKNKHRGSVHNFSSHSTSAATPTLHRRVQTKMFQRHISKEEASYKTHKQSAILLITVTFTFICLTLPLYISYLLFAFAEYRKDPKTHSLLILIYHTAHKMYIANSAINFILYLLAGTRFRKDFIGLFLCNQATDQSNTSSVSQQITSRISSNNMRK